MILQKSLKTILLFTSLATLANLWTFAADPENIILGEIKGRHWLIMPNGSPFFAHGITHAGNRDAKLNFQKFSKACKQVGFNAYGYGCPEPLRNDMPFIESWNHLVPISYYRGKNAVRFIDVFDPKAQAKLENGVKVNCLRSRNNPNLIGYCWTDLGSWTEYGRTIEPDGS